VYTQKRSRTRAPKIHRNRATAQIPLCYRRATAQIPRWYRHATAGPPPRYHFGGTARAYRGRI